MLYGYGNGCMCQLGQNKAFNTHEPTLITLSESLISEAGTTIPITNSPITNPPTKNPPITDSQPITPTPITPTPTTPSDSINTQKIQQISCGCYHTIIKTNKNKIFSWGVNDEGALGRNTPEEIPLIVNLPPKINKIKKIVTTDDASFILTTNGILYGCGTFKNNKGIIGYNKQIKKQMVFTKINTTIKFKQIVAGGSHILLISDTNHVYGMGTSQYKQLLVVSDCFIDLFKLTFRKIIKTNKKFISNINSIQLNLKEKVLNVFAGTYTSFIKTNKRIISFGRDTIGELGININLNTKKSINTNTDTSMNMNTSMNTDTNTSMNTDTNKNINTNMNKNFFEIFTNKHNQVIKIQGGEGHTLFLMKNGDIYASGNNIFGQCGTGNNINIVEPIKINNTFNNQKIIDFSVNGNFSLLLTETKKFISFGLNTSGELGFSQDEIIRNVVRETPFNLKTINCFSTGNDFVIFDGEI
ncbi:Ultraviolet-B receptor UVR8 [Cucumispora dikerogammari]|nr:Ultraviolet-B receptor UVR8 [Cucumispora dikerogammari]